MDQAHQSQTRNKLQQQLRQIARDSDAAPWDWDLISSEVYFSPRWWIMLGFEVDEVPASASLWLSLCHPDDMQRVEKELARALADGGEYFQAHYRLRHRRGHYIAVFSRMHIRRDAKKKPIRLMGVNTDLTEYTPSGGLQDRLDESEARFQTLTELMADWYWEMDGQFRLTRINECSVHDTKLNPQDFIGKRLWELAHSGVDKERWAEHRAALQSHKLIVNFEVQYPGRDNSPVFLSFGAAPAFDEQCVFKGYWGVARDVSASRNTEKALREAQMQFQSLLDWSAMGLAIYQNGRIVHANPTALRAWGAEQPAELMGMTIGSRFHPQFRTSTLNRFRAMKTGDVHTEVRESRLLRLDGRAVDVQIQAMPVPFQGQPAIQIIFHDISARKQIEANLRESEARFRTLTQLSADWYWEQDENFRFVLLNGDVETGTGLPSKDWIGKTAWDVPALNLSSTDWDLHRAALEAHQEFRDFEIRRPDSARGMHWASVSGKPTFDANWVFRGYRGIGRNINSQKESTDRIHRLAFYDTLTGLPNRRFLMDRLRKTIQLNARHHQRAALLFLDLDNFKVLNDTLGHDMGDILLQQVAARLVACVRDTDTVARLGGDEFVVVIEDLDEKELDAATKAGAVGQKILAALNASYLLAGREHRSSPSIGITLFGSNVPSVDDVLKQADLAMYQAKMAGRNTLRFFDAAMQHEVNSRVTLESDLRDGLQGGEELMLHLQPIVAVDGRVIGAEALVRWLQPVRGLMVPEEFIALAQATALILPLGRWVLQTACEQLALWAGKPESSHLTLAVNISLRELREPDFVSHILRTLHLTGAPANRLRLELTENALTQKVDDTMVKMTELKAHGIGFSLDDFGTGYSSLSVLKKLPFDMLKIDHSFVRDILTNPDDAAIARSIVALGKSLHLSIVAEGVETQEQRAFLAANGCYAYQGYLIGKPMPIEDFDAFLLKSRIQTSDIAG